MSGSTASTIAAAALLLAAGLAVRPESGSGTSASAERVDRAELSSCFWEGPISTRMPTTRGFDGRNFNFAEESATYWLARFNLPEGTTLELHGRYPHGRYMSLNAYSDGDPTDGLSDLAIEARDGHTNPFIDGHRRDLNRRSWTVTVVDAPPPDDATARTPNTLYAQPALGAAIELVYRVYEPDPGADLTGDARLPIPVARLADGTAIRKEACARLNDPNREITIDTVPPALWQTARSSPGCDPNTNPAYDPIRWERFFNVDYASLAVITDCTANGRATRLGIEPELRGGFYSNRDSAYIYAHLAQEFGPVVAIEGKLPRFPRTYLEPKRMPTGQLRFWSLCTGESRVTVRTPDCLADRQVLKRSGRNYTIAVSKRADRPANARSRCDVAWLEWGDRGDGTGDPGYGLLILRNMLAFRRFAEAIQRVARPGEEEAVMGRYFPRASYSSVDDFEARGCKR